MCRYDIAPDVVLRQFAHETVALNFRTKQFHGLNPTAGRMMEVLGREATPAAALKVLARDFKRPVADIEPLLSALIEDLLERDLIVRVQA